MTQSIPAKPTEYNGRVYRSRLEARFAEWLTDNGVRFEYETEIAVGYAQTFLPDFFLPDYGVYVEIKPRERREELRMASETILKSGQRLVVVDSPERGAFEAYENYNVLSAGQVTEGPGLVTLKKVECSPSGAGGLHLCIGHVLTLLPLALAECGTVRDGTAAVDLNAVPSTEAPSPEARAAAPGGMTESCG